MAHNVSPVERYDFTSGDELFLDTNIWLFIYGPQNPDPSKNKKMYTYS